jgi:carbamate kinase
MVMSVLTKKGPVAFMVLGAMVFGTIGYKMQLNLEKKLAERTKQKYLKIAEEIEEEERQTLGLPASQKVVSEQVLDTVDKKLTGRT